jgi:hypothetical protein
VHGSLGEPSERGEGVAAGFSGEEVSKGEAGDGLLADVVVKGTDEEKVGQCGVVEWRQRSG